VTVVRAGEPHEPADVVARPCHSAAEASPFVRRRGFLAREGQVVAEPTADGRSVLLNVGRCGSPGGRGGRARVDGEEFAEQVPVLGVAPLVAPGRQPQFQGGKGYDGPPLPGPELPPVPLNPRGRAR
jgi:hypothetical protein